MVPRDVLLSKNGRVGTSAAGVGADQNRLRGWWLIAEGTMGPALVVLTSSLLGEHSDLLHGIAHLPVQEFVP